MITYEIEDKKFRPVTLYLPTQNDIDMLEVICNAVISDKVTTTAQSAAKALIAVICEINEDQME